MALQGSDIQKNSWVFDFDDQWSKDKHFVIYDYRLPDAVPRELHHTFDMVVIDPPFITGGKLPKTFRPSMQQPSAQLPDIATRLTEEVWRKYADTAKLLLKDGGAHAS